LFGTALHLAAIRKFGLPTAPAEFGVQPATVLDGMLSDKKATGSGITLILVRGIGKAFLSAGVGLAELADFLER